MWKRLIWKEKKFLGWGMWMEELEENSALGDQGTPGGGLQKSLFGGRVVEGCRGVAPRAEADDVRCVLGKVEERESWFEDKK